MASKRYAEESKKLGIAIDCALAALQKHPPAGWSPEQLAHFNQFYADAKQEVLQPPLYYRNLASMHYQVQNVFTYFQEASGECVEYFWEQIQQLNLGYERVNLLQKILKRGKVGNQAEYDYATDLLVAAQQEGHLSAQDSQKLSDFIGRFELKQNRSPTQLGR